MKGSFDMVPIAVGSCVDVHEQLCKKMRSVGAHNSVGSI